MKSMTSMMTRLILCGALLSLAVMCPSASTQTPTQTRAAGEDPGGALRTFRTYFVKSDTIYMKAETLRKALERRPEFAAWGLEAVGDRQKAEVIIEVTLPFLTWEWNYKMMRVSTGAPLGTGKVKALTEDIAAPQLAAQMAERIKAVRALPQAPEQPPDKPASRTGEETPATKEWAAEYVSGTPRVRPGKVTLTTSQDEISCRSREGASFTIPLKYVVVVEHGTEKNPVDWAGLWEVANPEGELLIPSLGTSLVALPIGLVGGVIVEAIPPEHFVRIDWLEDGEVQNAVLKAGNYEALLKEIAEIRQKAWIDIPREVKEVREELKKPGRQSWLVSLDRPAQVGWIKLPEGTYEVVFLSREGQLGQVYFVPWKIEGGDSQPLAHAVVQVESRTDARESPSSQRGRFATVQYKAENGMTRIAEISKDGRVWRFTLAPLKLETPQAQQPE